MSSLFINEFLDGITSALKRIASQTKGEYSHEDLRNEAYFYILEFDQEHERYPSPWDDQDKDWVLGRMYNHFVKWVDQDFRKSLRIGSLENDEGDAWDFELPAEEHSDPIMQLLFREHSAKLEDMLQYSYSEAKAYVVAFGQFDSDKSLLSSYLFITTDTLDNRCARAIQIVEQQPSLFDYIETIDDSFSPMPGWEKLKANGLVAKQQLALHFG
jgi:hypothetical protein